LLSFVSFYFSESRLFVVLRSLLFVIFLLGGDNKKPRPQKGRDRKHGADGEGVREGTRHTACKSGSGGGAGAAPAASVFVLLY
jgi:hypothetical protein